MRFKKGYTLSHEEKAEIFNSEIRKRMSESHSGVSKSEVTKKKMSDAHSGVPKSEEHRRKIAEAMRGNNNRNKNRDNKQ